MYTRQTHCPQIALPGPETLPLATQPQAFQSSKEQGNVIWGAPQLLSVSCSGVRKEGTGESPKDGGGGKTRPGKQGSPAELPLGAACWAPGPPSPEGPGPPRGWRSGRVGGVTSDDSWVLLLVQRPL